MNKDQFIDIVTEHQKLIFKVCNSYCSDVESRKDLDQEILIQLWNALDKFDGRVKLSTWIYKIALNTAISFYRKESKKTRDTELKEQVITLQKEEYDKEWDVKLTMLNTFLSELGRLDRALMLLYLDGYKNTEIAELFGITPSNVSTKINRIKGQLKDKFINKKI